MTMNEMIYYEGQNEESMWLIWCEEVSYEWENNEMPRRNTLLWRNGEKLNDEDIINDYDIWLV